MPVAPAGWNVWQPLQPLSAKTFLPAAGFALPAFGSVPDDGARRLDGLLSAAAGDEQDGERDQKCPGHVRRVY